MQIVLEIGAGRARRFHRLLRDRLSRRFPQSSAALRFVEGAPPAPGAIAALLALERLIFRRSRETLCDPLPECAMNAEACGAPARPGNRQFTIRQMI